MRHVPGSAGPRPETRSKWYTFEHPLVIKAGDVAGRCRANGAPSTYGSVAENLVRTKLWEFIAAGDTRHRTVWMSLYIAIAVIQWGNSMLAAVATDGNALASCKLSGIHIKE